MYNFIALLQHPLYERFVRCFEIRAETLVPFCTLIPRLAIGLIRGADWLKATWLPTAGLQYENIVDAPKGKPTGAIVRSYANLDVEVYTEASRLRNRLVLSSSYSYWEDLHETLTVDDDRERHLLLRSSVTMYFDQARHYGMGFDYVRGEDPTNGLKDQTYELLSFKIKY